MDHLKAGNSKKVSLKIYHPATAKDAERNSQKRDGDTFQGGFPLATVCILLLLRSALHDGGGGKKGSARHSSGLLRTFIFLAVIRRKTTRRKNVNRNALRFAGGDFVVKI